MADWKIVRFDPNYPEPLDVEIIPLCDAMNAAGLVTTSSCCGHGSRWPHVWFDHPYDAYVEALARHVMAREGGDYRPHYTMWQKDIRPEGFGWSLEVHLNNVYATTPGEEALAMAVVAINQTAEHILAFHKDHAT